MTDVDLFGLKGAHVVITGASGGIGIATVKLFDQLGARISAHRNTQKDVHAGTTNSLNVIQADATNEADVERFYNVACEKFGAPDILVGMQVL
jgi:NAD(P)-dependent dehydrogenase (short-subunit alcohol dehydrogenase family)